MSVNIYDAMWHELGLIKCGLNSRLFDYSRANHDPWPRPKSSQARPTIFKVKAWPISLGPIRSPVRECDDRTGTMAF